ncbi:MAG: hypothetical protein Q9178_007853 [Gyalolechia marmorata]
MGVSDIYSRTNIISIWLDSHPESSDGYDTAPVQQLTPRIPPKRRRLASISGNGMPPRKLRKDMSLVKDRPASSPTKSNGFPTPQTPHRRQNSEPHDQDKTPKASFAINSAPRLLLHGNSDPEDEPELEDELELEDGPESEDNVSEDTSAPPDSSTSSVSSRVDRLADLHLSDMPVKLVEYGTKGCTITQALESFWRDICKISKGCRVIPQDIREEALKEMDLDEEDGTYHLARGDDTATQTQDGGLTSHQVWARTKEIHEAALECSNARLSEAAWNSEVHSRLFRLALQGDYRSKGIWYQDVTAARIRERKLLAKVGGLSIQSKMVDYALVIKPSVKMEGQIRSRMRTLKLKSLSASHAEYMRFEPCASFMETKRGPEGGDKGHVQLGTWIGTNFNKLKQMVGNDANLPAIPLLISYGHNWNLMIAQMKDNELLLLSDRMLGSTNTLLGIYQVLAAIRRLAKWADEQYRPWFEKTFLEQS